MIFPSVSVVCSQARHPRRRRHSTAHFCLSSAVVVTMQTFTLVSSMLVVVLLVLLPSSPVVLGKVKEVFYFIPYIRKSKVSSLGTTLIVK